MTDEASGGPRWNGRRRLPPDNSPTTPDRTKKYWMSQPIGFSPDYIYVQARRRVAASPRSQAGRARHQGRRQTGGRSIRSARIADLQAAGAEHRDILDTPAAALKAVVDGQALGFVGSSLEYAVAASADPSISQAGDRATSATATSTRTAKRSPGESRPATRQLLDALDQSNTLAWQKKVIGDAYRPGVAGRRCQRRRGSRSGAWSAPGSGRRRTSSMRSIWVSEPGPAARVRAAERPA